MHLTSFIPPTTLHAVYTAACYTSQAVWQLAGVGGDESIFDFFQLHFFDFFYRIKQNNIRFRSAL